MRAKRQSVQNGPRYHLQLDEVITGKGAATTSLPRPDFFVRRRPPTPSHVFPTYWQFAKRRQDLFFGRVSQSTTADAVADPILRQYRFTNTFRASDRVSQFLIRRVLYDAKWSANDTVFRTLIFKFFNKIETWQELEAAVGEITWRAYDFSRFDTCLTDMMSRGARVYSAAYIMPSGKSAFGQDRKHRNHLMIIERIMRDGLPTKLARARHLADVYALLREYPCIGPFIGYQLAIDLNYSSLIDFSENDFVEAGPGALDGISKTFVDMGDYSPAEVIHYMTDIQEEAFGHFAPGFRNLWGRRLHLIDCQNVFCEVSKYARIAHPEVVGRANRTRIKQLYRPATLPFSTPWYPPKWGLNERIVGELAA